MWIQLTASKVFVSFEVLIHRITLASVLALPCCISGLSVAWHRQITYSINIMVGKWPGSCREPRVFPNAPSMAWHWHTINTLCITNLINAWPGSRSEPLVFPNSPSLACHWHAYTNTPYLQQVPKESPRKNKVQGETNHRTIILICWLMDVG